MDHPPLRPKEDLGPTRTKTGAAAHLDLPNLAAALIIIHVVLLNAPAITKRTFRTEMRAVAAMKTLRHSPEGPDDHQPFQELSSEIWHQVVDVLAEQSGLPIANYHADTKELEQIYSRRGWYYSGTIDVLVGLIMQSYAPCKDVVAYVSTAHISHYLPPFDDSKDAYGTMEQHLERAKYNMQELFDNQGFLPATAIAKANLRNIYFAVNPTNTHWVTAKGSADGDIIV
ncbi:hypothetical protein KCU65_g8940, partial [Aureobasidium melanogenum]